MFELDLLTKVDNSLINAFFTFTDFVFNVDGIDIYVVPVDVGSEKIDIWYIANLPVPHPQGQSHTRTPSGSPWPLTLYPRGHSATTTCGGRSVWAPSRPCPHHTVKSR